MGEIPSRSLDLSSAKIIQCWLHDQIHFEPGRTYLVRYVIVPRDGYGEAEVSSGITSFTTNQKPVFELPAPVVTSVGVHEATLLIVARPEWCIVNDVGHSFHNLMPGCYDASIQVFSSATDTANPLSKCGLRISSHTVEQSSPDGWGTAFKLRAPGDMVAQTARLWRRLPPIGCAM